MTDKQNIERIMAYMKDFPPSLHSYNRLEEAMKNPYSEIRIIHNIIEEDRYISVKILRTVNSQAYHLESKINTISQAIFKLGINEIKNLYLLFSIIKEFDNYIPKRDFSIHDFWEHAFAVGVISRILGKTIGLRNLEDFFFEVVIHDLPRLVYNIFIPCDFSASEDITGAKHISLMENETKEYNLFHTYFLDFLTNKWTFPERFVNVLKYYSIGLIDGKKDYLVGSVHLAHDLAHILKLGCSEENPIPEPNISIWNYMHLTSEIFFNTYPNITKDFNCSASILKIA